MKQKRMMIVAVACGVVCALCVGVFMVNVQGEANAARAEALARYGGEQVEVCVATRDVAAGERLDLSAVETRLWVADLLPDEAVSSTSDAIGKIATSSIIKGEVISAKRFESDRGTLDVPAGKRAVSVPAKAVQAVGGAIRPGMYVDVYASGNTETSLLAHDVLVIDTSVGDSSSLVSSETGWVTLAVDSEAVQEVVAASTKSELHFVLPGEQLAVASDDAAGASGNEAQASAASEPSSSSEASDASGDAQSAGSQTVQDGEPSASASSSSESAQASASSSAASSNGSAQSAGTANAQSGGEGR